MKKFRFRLEKLLDIRKSSEDRAKNSLAKVMGRQNIERMKQERALESFNLQKARYSERLRSGAPSAREMLLHSRFTDSSLRSMEAAENRVKEIQPEVDLRRAALAEASMARKVIEKLKEKRESEYLYELNRTEFRENDDINQNLFAKRRKQENADD